MEQLKENEDEEIQFLHTIQFDEDSARPIRAKQTGYVQLVGHDTIFNRLEDEDVQIFLKVRPGDFVVEGQTIASIIEKEEHRLLLPQEDSEDIEVDSFVNQHITIQDVRNESYDYRYSIQKVEEVAIRALSPGVNDPYTAVQCVNTMSELIRKLASYDAGYFILKEDERPATVFYTSIAFEEDIYDFFREIILYGVGDLEVVHALFDGYKSISSNASKANLEAIRTVAQYTYDKAIENYAHTLDIKGIQKDFHHLMDFIASKEKSVES